MGLLRGVANVVTPGVLYLLMVFILPRYVRDSVTTVVKHLSYCFPQAVFFSFKRMPLANREQRKCR